MTSTFNEGTLTKVGIITVTVGSTLDKFELVVDTFYCTIRYLSRTEVVSKDGLPSRCKVYCNGGKAANRNGKVLRRNLQYDESHRVFRGIKQKLCIYCRKWKDENSFYKQNASRDGLSPRCKERSNKYAREQYTPITKRRGSYLKYEQCHRTVRGIKEKVCSGCKKWKKENEFYRNRVAKDGLNSQCKECRYKPNKSQRRP